MSYIDIIQHEFVGYFAGYPIYHPLENKPESEVPAGEFPCTVDDLILGGGGGEHPGLIFKNPNYIVLTYIDLWFHNESKFNENFTNEMYNHFSDIMNITDYDGSTSDSLYFCNWGVEEYHEFYVACSSNAVMSPFVKGERTVFFEEWLVASFGELIFFSFPDMALEIRSDMKEIFEYINKSIFHNILILPPNHVPNAGYLIKDKNISRNVTSWDISRRK